MLRLSASRTGAVIGALGTAQTIGWASSYYLPAVLATPMAADLGLSPVWVFATFSMAMVVSAAVGPPSGAWIDAGRGRGVLALSNLIFAAGLVALALVQGPTGLVLAWLVIGIGMGAGLYESAFAALTTIYGAAARNPITGITLIAGFASTVGWPLSGLMLAQWGWREACLGWAALHLVLALPLNLILPLAAPAPPRPEPGSDESPPQAPFWPMALLAFVFAATWFTSTAMAAHLPRLLELAGASTAAAIAAGALIGPAQVGARVLEFGLLRRFHPLVSARVAALTHPAAAVVLVAVGGPAAALFAVLHGAGNGILTISRGTLPLALFGPVGYGARLGWIGMPSRVLQAAAPLLFGAALTGWGLHAIWVTAGISLAAFVALLALRQTGAAVHQP